MVEVVVARAATAVTVVAAEAATAWLVLAVLAAAGRMTSPIRRHTWWVATAAVSVYSVRATAAMAGSLRLVMAARAVVALQ